jgi:hypothetical protein
MRRLLMGVVVLSLLVAGPVVRIALADGESVSPEESERARQSLERMQREVVESEKQRKEDGAAARKRLATEFHVDASKMDDTEAIARLRDARSRPRRSRTRSVARSSSSRTPR